MTGFSPNFTGMFLTYRLKLLITVTEKSGLWSDTGAQEPLLCFAGVI